MKWFCMFSKYKFYKLDTILNEFYKSLYLFE